MSKPKCPPLVYVPAPCPGCGAVNMDEANDKCRPTTDETGERSCSGEFNDDGVSVQPTKESLDAQDRFFCAASSGI
jgi:hypothetical protein